MRFLLPLLLLAGCVAAEAPASEVISVKATAVALNPKQPAQQTVGRLRYMGGLVLRSDDKRFGGISGLRWVSRRGSPARPVAELLAVTDFGNWIVFEPREEKGRLVGVARATMGALKGLDGRPLAAKVEADAEALTLVEDCHALDNGCIADAAAVSFERDHRIWFYDFGPEGGLSSVPKDAGFAHAWLKRQPQNGGVEAMAGDADWFVLFSEGLRDTEGRVEGRDLFCHACRTSDGSERAFALDLPTLFQPTDAVSSRQGLLLLSRSFSSLRGVAMRIDLVDITDGEDGSPSIAGTLTPVATLRPPLSVDNMEGLAVRQEGDRTFLYIVSDNNFSAWQRTLLLKFELLPEAP